MIITVSQWPLEIIMIIDHYYQLNSWKLFYHPRLSFLPNEARQQGGLLGFDGPMSNGFSIDPLYTIDLKSSWALTGAHVMDQTSEESSCALRDSYVMDSL